MSYGIKTVDANGYINLHSDYSSIVYYGEMSLIASPQRPVYTSRVSMTESLKDTNYDMGWLTQYQISGISTDYLLPFYRPNFDNQQIGILDVIKKDSTTWIVNLIYNGSSDQYPRVFAFAPLSAIPKPTLSAYGLVVYDENGKLVFTDSKPPLRVDDSVLITHPSAIRTTDKGGCGRFGTDCHVNFTPDKSAYFYGTVNNTSTKLYHIVPSAYGGLAYKNYQTGSESCDSGLGSRQWVFNYQSWASFRGTVGHSFNNTYHKAGWLADYAGAFYQSEESRCGYGGPFAIVLGALAVIFTGGGALTFVAGYLVGFALSVPQATPSLKAYETDQVFDTNNSSNLIITDARYYGIDGLSPAKSIKEDPPTPAEIPFSSTNEIYNPFVYVNPYDGAYYVAPFAPVPDAPDYLLYYSSETFWLDYYINGTFVSSWVKYKANNIYPELDKTFAENVTVVYDNFNGYIFSRGTLIMEYANPNKINTYKLYAVFKKDFEYSSPLTSTTTGVPTTKWVIFYDNYFQANLRIYYNRYYINSSTTSGLDITIQNVDPDITSYTYNGYTYYRGKFMGYSPSYNFEYYSITRS